MSPALAGADGQRMDPELWSRIEVILDGALDLQGADRKTFLSRATQGDEALRNKVEELLAVEEPALGFIEKPLFSVPTDKGWETDDRDLEEGSLIGVYRVERRIGRGGMGAVYLARRDDQLFDKQVSDERSHPTFVDSFDTFRMAVKEGDVSVPDVVPSQPLRNECEHFLDCVIDGQRSRSGPREGVEVVAVLEAISRSLAERGAEVAVEPVGDDAGVAEAAAQ